MPHLLLPGNDLPRLVLPLLFAALVLPLARSAQAQQASVPEEQLEQLKLEMTRLRAEYESRIAELERRLSELEAGVEDRDPDAISDETIEEDSLAALRAAAREAASGVATTPGAAPSQPVVVTPASQGERNLNRLNPEISFSGDALLLTGDDSREEFSARELEFSFQSDLDPFTSTKVFLAVGPDGEVELEEAYVRYNRLPGGLSLRAGKLRQDFGVLNRWHGHALPFSDYPLVLTSFFGEEGLGQTGVSLDWLLPRPWASANELSLQLTNGENDAFGGETFDSLAALLHLKNYWDVNAATYFEWGLSGIAGETALGGDNRVLGTDLTLHWQPPSRAKYRELTFRSELMLSQRDDELGRQQDALGFYSYVEGLVARNLYLGFRYDDVEDPLLPSNDTRGFTANLSWWQSEFVRLRGEYSYLDRLELGKDESRFLLQLTFAAGPHKHETY